MPKQSTVLKISAVAIAAPRYMGAFAVSIGESAIEQVPFFVLAEIITGGAMALLEGFALAFVLSKWRLLKTGSTHWYVLLTFVCLLALTVPLVAMPYLLVEQSKQTVTALFADLFALQAIWSFIVAAVPMLVIMAVGFADISDSERITEESGVIIAKQQNKAKIKQAKFALEQTELATKASLEQKQSANGAKLEQKYSCDFCSKSYKSAKALNGHLAQCSKRKQAMSKLEQA